MKLFKKTYSFLQSRRKKIKFRSIMMIVFLLGVNAYAWFVYMSNASVDVSSSVSTWNVTFFDGTEEIKDLEINTGNIYPGMETYTKQFKIKNKSDTKATFNYEVDNLKIFDNDITVEDKETYLKELLPFKVKLTPSKTELDKNDTIVFDISIDWPYESENDYYKVLDLYQYQENFNYYEKTDTGYNKVSISEISYPSKVASGIYIESDDADTYLGSECDSYKQTYGSNSCLKFHIKLNVIQK